MKIIADGGASTKHTGANTRDAIILGLHTPYIDGFKFKLYLTKDHEIITLSDDVYQFFTQFIHNIEDMELKELIAYNIGSRVQRQKIITLDEILVIFEYYQKDLVLELVDHKEQNALLVDLVLSKTRKYPQLKLYYETKELEIFEYLKSSNILHPLGLVINENNIDNFFIDANFYDIAIELLNVLDIRKKVEEGHLIMIDQVNREDVFNLIYREYQDIFQAIYIITSKLSNINSASNFQTRKKEP